MMDWELGFQAFREGRIREAVDRLGAAADERERTVSLGVRFQTLTFLGAALYALGKATEAAIAFQQAVRIAPPPMPPVDLTINLANAYLAAGRRGDARRALLMTLRNAPGNQEALMLLRRLDQQAPDEPVTGATLGESPEGARKYLRTLSFSRVSAGGLDPAQVKLALTQIELYLDFLAAQIAERDESIARLEAELERFHQMEDTLVENLIKAQQLADQQQRAASHTDAASGDAPALTPLQALFQQKP